MAKFHFIMTLMILQGNFLSYGQQGSEADGSDEQGPSVEDESGMGSEFGTNPSVATDSEEEEPREKRSTEDAFIEDGSGEGASGEVASGEDGSSSGSGQEPVPLKPPEPRNASKEEREEAVQFSIPRDFEWDVAKDKSFKETMASVTTEFCTENRTKCALKEARRNRRSPELYTVDNVHLLPGYPSNASGSLQVAFYVQQPLGQFIGNISVLPRSTLVEIVKNNKSDIETAIGANISDVEFFFKPATPTTPTKPTTPVRAEQLESSSNVGKWAAIGVGVAVVIIILIIFIVFRWMKSKAPNMKINHRSPGLEGGDAWGSYNFYES